MMSILSAVRLKALVLMATFLASSAGVAAADVVRHHQDRADRNEGRHIELPGSCLDHEHQCDLGMSVGGPKLLFSSGDTLETGQATIKKITPTPLAGLQSEPLFHLPPTRAPPGL